MVAVIKGILILFMVVCFGFMLIGAARSAKRDSDSRERIAVALEKIADK